MSIPKNGTQMNYSQLAKADRLTLTLADVQGRLTYTKLPPAKAKRSQMIYTSGVVNAGRGSGRSLKVG
jgi:hypothetical protein